MPRSFAIMSILLIVASSQLLLAAAGPRIGKPAPKIEVGDWILFRPTAGDPLRGKVVVLEFWATWCAPCKAAIPHLNKLADKYSSRGVQFVSLSDEQKTTVEKFVQKYPISGLVAIDTSRHTHRAFAVSGIPVTFLIDRRGILRWQGGPNALTDEWLGQFLRTGLVPRETSTSSAPPTGSLRIDSTTLASITLKRPTALWGSQALSQSAVETKMDFNSQPLKIVLSSILDLPPSSIRGEDSILARKVTVDFLVRLPVNLEDVRQPTVSVLCSALSLEVKSGTELRDVYQMSIADSSRLLTFADELGETQTISRGKSWRGERITLSELAVALNSLFNQSISYAGQDVGRYTLSLPRLKFEDALDTLKGTYGLSLAKSQTMMKFVSITEAAR